MPLRLWWLIAQVLGDGRAIQFVDVAFHLLRVPHWH